MDLINLVSRSFLPLKVFYPQIKGKGLMVVIPIDNWTKMFSLCDKEGERLLVLETTSESTILVAGTISGISFELFRTQGISLKLGIY